MLPLLAPILAQLVTLNVGDRTEARYVSGTPGQLEGTTRPLAGLNFGWKRTNLLIAYTPSISVVPLDRKPRDVAVFQAGSVTASYIHRRTTLTLSGFAGYGQLIFRAQALADPGVNLGTNPPTAGTPTQPTAGQTPLPGSSPTTPGTGVTMPRNPNTQATDQVQLKNKVVHYFTWTTFLGVTHIVARGLSVGANTSYSEGRGVGDQDSINAYPLLRGVRVSANATQTEVLDRRNALASTLVGQYASSSNGNRVTELQLTEIWAHRLNPLTLTRFGAGLSGSRLDQDDGTVQYSIYPTFIAGIIHFDRLAGGVITVSFTLTGQPYIDPLRATVDPRLSMLGTAVWTKRRFAIGASAGAALSLQDTETNGAVNSVGATLFANYQLGAGFTLDGGLQTAWQTFEGTSIIPATWSAFIGITYGASMPLNGHAGH